MNSRLTIVILIISIVALAFSVFNTFYIFQLEQKENKSISDLKAITDKIAPLTPQFETLGKVLPRLNQLLLAIPPVPETK